MTPNFMNRAAKIMAEIRTRTSIDKIDTEVLFEIVQDALNEYYDELNEYYEEEYYTAITSARSRAYDAGYEDGYDECYSESHSVV